MVDEFTCSVPVGMHFAVTLNLRRWLVFGIGIELGLSPEQAHWPHPQDVALGSHREQLEVIIAPEVPTVQHTALSGNLELGAAARHML